MVAAGAPMNAATKVARVELRLGLGRAIRAIRIDVSGRVALVQKSIKLLAVMHAGVGHLILPDQFALGVCIHVVLVAVEALAVLLGPARILVFLPVFRRVLLPSLGRFCRPLRPHSRPGYSVAWEPERSWHQSSDRRAQRSLSLPNAGQSARTASQSDQPSQALRGTTTMSCRPECDPRCRAAESA